MTAGAELATVVYCVLQQAQAKRIVPCDWIIDMANETARYIIKISISIPPMTGSVKKA